MKLYAHWDGRQPFTKVIRLDDNNTIADLRVCCWEVLAARHPELEASGPGALHLVGPDRRPLPLNTRLEDVLSTGDDVFFRIDSARGSSTAHASPPAATTSTEPNGSRAHASDSSGLNALAVPASSGATSTAPITAPSTTFTATTTPAAPQAATRERTGPHSKAMVTSSDAPALAGPQVAANCAERPGGRGTAAARSPSTDAAAPKPRAAAGQPPSAAAAAAEPLVPVVRALWLHAEELATQLHYRGAGEVLQQVLLLVPDAEASPTHIATLLRLARLWLSAGNPGAASQWALRAAKLRPNDPGVLELAGDCLREGGRPREAAAQYQSALEVLQEEEEVGDEKQAAASPRRADGSDGAGSRSGSRSGPTAGPSEALVRLRVSLAACLADIPGSITPPYDNQDLAASLVMAVLERDPGHWEALRLYARIALQRGLADDALRVALRLVVGQPKHSGAKALLADCLKDEAGCRKLYEELGLPVADQDAEAPAASSAIGSRSSGDSSTAAALAFVATAVKDFGKVDTCITLLQRAVHLDLTNPSYSLNLVHALELRQDLQEAVAVGRRYCRRCGTQLAGRPLKDVDDLLADLPQLRDPLQLNWYTAEPLWGSQPQSLQAPSPALAPVQPGESAGETPGGGKRQEVGDGVASGSGGAEGSGAAKGVVPAKVTYDSDQLDELALLFTLAKVLFVGGALSAAAQLCAVVEPLRRASAVELHTTLIRNETAYFGCVAQLLRNYPPPPAAPPGGGGPAPLYLCGDSHCLSAAWRIVTLRGEQRLLRPLLVTGCKVWHLRPASEFYPKKQFEITTRMLPDGAQVVLIFGEIDCREGLLLAVQKGKYDSVAEGIDATVAIYLEVIRELVVNRRMEVFLHPVPPVLNETRAVVAPFTAALRAAVAAAREADTQLRRRLHYLDFFSQLLVPLGKAATVAAQGSTSTPVAVSSAPRESQTTGADAGVPTTDSAVTAAGGSDSHAPSMAAAAEATCAAQGGGNGGAESSEGGSKGEEVAAARVAGGGVPGPGGWALRPDLAFDGTHLAPTYLPLLDAALAQVP